MYAHTSTHTPSTRETERVTFVLSSVPDRGKKNNITLRGLEDHCEILSGAEGPAALF